MQRIRVLLITLVAILAMGATAFAASSGRNFVAHLSAGEEVMPVGVVNDSLGQGQAIFRLDKSGEALSFKLIVANIENVNQAHIHCGASGVNGPVTVFLFGLVDPGGGRFDGVLSQGVITPDDVIPLPDSAACPGGIADFSGLLEKIRAGMTYVNVHTNDGVGDPNTGPGDFPGGEIRGQIQ